MSARRIKDKPMKYWGFYASTELKAETIECAKKLDIGDSEYIRKAVEAYNKQMQQFIDDDNYFNTHKNNHDKVTCPTCKELIDVVPGKALKHECKNNTVSKPNETIIYTGPVEYVSVEPVITQKQSKPTIPELKEKVKEMESPKCNSFLKGGK